MNRGRLTVQALGVVLSGAAWVALVRLAIGIADPTPGEDTRWSPLLLTSLAAAVCLGAALAFGRRFLVSLGVLSDYRPKRALRGP